MFYNKSVASLTSLALDHNLSSIPSFLSPRTESQIAPHLAYFLPAFLPLMGYTNKSNNRGAERGEERMEISLDISHQGIFFPPAVADIPNAIHANREARRKATLLMQQSNRECKTPCRKPHS